MAPSSSVSAYDILGIDKSASVEDVRKAYKRKALETHPDKLGPEAKEDERIRAEEEFRKVNEAFQLLSDSRKRQGHDARFKRDPGKQPSSEDLKRRMRERAEWAQQLEERQLNRIEALRKKRQAEIQREKEAERFAKMVNEMVGLLNQEIPGWIERKQKVQQMKAAREARVKQATRAH